MFYSVDGRPVWDREFRRRKIPDALSDVFSGEGRHVCHQEVRHFLRDKRDFIRDFFLKPDC
jgi:hypothetical protein